MLNMMKYGLNTPQQVGMENLNLPDVQAFLYLLGSLRSSSLSSLVGDAAELLHCANLFSWVRTK